MSMNDCINVQKEYINFNLFYLTVALLYLPLIFILRNCPKYNLTNFSFIWNLLSCIYGGITAYLLFKDRIMLYIFNFNDTVCMDLNPTGSIITIYTMFIFLFSKIPEMIDTIILRLTKKPVNFLHWFHHITVMLYCWYVGNYYKCGKPNGYLLLFAGMNAFVHFVMYGYYAIAVYWKGIYRYAQAITVVQLFQFVIGVYALITANSCVDDKGLIYCGLFIYISYLVLFLMYYFKRYSKKRK